MSLLYCSIATLLVNTKKKTSVIAELANELALLEVSPTQGVSGNPRIP